ncbi:hypothetical protein [Paremcibacter congregatus]|uniref:hypothetical protein n=1 Tax=Paremcibacter congregatus TaxID=2043170 RepID=UPI0030EF263F|tara:strand:- start:2557 stop:2949 length:393 start_codon:yes stop_codon:yes gene_type:complete
MSSSQNGDMRPPQKCNLRLFVTPLIGHLVCNSNHSLCKYTIKKNTNRIDNNKYTTYFYCMSKFNKHSEIISLWPSVGEFAADIGEKESTCRGWKLRNSIPAKYWQKIIVAAEGRGFETKITFESLALTAA